MAGAASGQPARRAQRTGVRISALSRWSVLGLAFLAIAIQSLVVQPHIHAQPADAMLASIVLEGASVEGDGTSGHDPLDPDQTECPVCQSAHQNGQYLKPAVAVFALPLSVNYRTIEFAQRPAQQQAVSHSWQGRAPPQA